ncbi:MAG: GNAT family N-acetyltransferase [Acidobacteria bacterium]|nr:GNAT family N-acetyltransferase [Acidobacteriota bacterium]
MTISIPAAAGRTEVLDLRYVAAEDLIPVLEEEAEMWRERLHWDFAASAELVVRFVGMRSLSGYALVVDGEVAGYSYYISEPCKGLIGDVFLARRFRTWERENQLIETTLRALIELEMVRRVESQLLMVDHPLTRRMPLPEKMQTFRRAFFIRAAGAAVLRESPGARRILLETWREERNEDAANLIVLGYERHIDSQINDQYQYVSGARSFLINIIQYPGCGRFFQPGSFLAFDRDDGQPCGLVLSSIVNEGVGHITQICVLPHARRYGIGYELMRAAIDALEAHGCHEVSLTVTSNNLEAIRLYERMGFVLQREFAAHVWDGLTSF